MSSRSLFLVACSFVAVAVILPPSASAAVTARYTYAPSKPLAETTTSFDASASICDQKPCSYTWRDDGSDGPGGDSTLLGTGSMLYETFHTAGGKVIRLTVTNRKGRASSTVKTISVSAAAPPPAPRCSNGQDDDGDGKIDYPNDPGCDSANDDTESPDPAPSSVQYVSPTAGATVGGVAPVRVRVPSGANWIGVYACGGRSVGEDLAPEADGTFTVQWDTTICANGQANLDTWAFRNDGSNLGHTEIFVSVNNTAQPPPPPAPAECNPASVPAPVVGLGFTQRFGDCFDTLDRTTWCSHQWWEANPPIGSQTVANGELRLRRERSTGYADTTMTTEPCGQANPRSYQYGYFEARMRYETVQGNGPAFWLFSTRHATDDDWPAINSACAEKGLPTIQCVSAELDVFEGFGKILYGGSRTDDFFSGTLHRNSCGCYGVANQSRFVQKGTGLDLSQWHTYAARWTPTQITYYIDGVAQGSVAPFDSTPQPMHLLLYNWNTGWEDENMPTSTTENELDVFVDWVRVWQQ